MGFLRIHCKNCGGYWDVYEDDDYRLRSYKTCPHCKEQIDGQDWEKQVIPAFGAMLDANKELKKTATGYKAPLFTVDFIQSCKVIGDRVVEDGDFDNYRDYLTETEKLTDGIEMLRDSVDQLTNALLTVDFVKRYS